MSQLALFETPPRARRRDPETSHKAARKIAVFKASQDAAIFAAIADSGKRGATAKDIAKVTTLTDVQANRRLKEMGDRGLIFRVLKPDAKHERDFVDRDGCGIWWKS